jgi:hypothetical protein
MGRPTSLSAAVFALLVSSTQSVFAGEPGKSRAGEGERVVLIRPEPSDVLLVDAWHRLAAELKIHHFDTDVVDAPPDAEPEEILSEVAAKRDAFAALALVHHDRNASVDVWLVDRASGKMTMRTIEVKNGRDASSVLAIRAVDLLRASLREYAEGERPPPDVVNVDRTPKKDTAVETIKTFAALPEPKVHLRAEVLVLVESGLGVAAGPSIGASYRVHDRLDLGIQGAGPLLGARLDTSNGSATTHQEMVWADIRFRLFRSGVVETGLDGAAGAFFLNAQGEPQPPLESRSDHVVTFLGGLGLHADFAFSRALAAGVAVRAMLTAPRAGVAVGDQSEPIELPMFVASAGLRVGL